MSGFEDTVIAWVDANTDSWQVLYAPTPAWYMILDIACSDEARLALALKFKSKILAGGTHIIYADN